MYLEVIRRNIIRLVTFILVLATIVVVACNGDDSPEATAVPAQPAATSLPAPQPTQAPQATQVPSVPQATQPPTAQPTAAAQPVTAEVHPGTVTILNTVWGAELYSTWALGEVMGYNRQLHAYWLVGDENVRILPGVLTAWEVSPDGLTWRLTIRDDIKFHNGDALTIDDAVFSMNSSYDETAANEGGPNVTSIARDTVSIGSEGNTVVIEHAKPLPFFPFVHTDMATNNNGALINKAYFESVGRDGFDENPIGAGPFKFVSHKFSDQMVFERNEDYYNPERSPNFTTLDMRLVPEASTRVSALIGGQADIVDANLQVINQVEGSGNRIVTARESSYMWVFMPGCYKSELPCHSKDFRQAMDYAVDKDLIVEQLYGEAAEVKGWGIVLPSSLGYYDGLDPFPYDPDKARELLAKAGFPGGEGLPKQTINTWVAGDVPFLPEQAQLIAQFWKDNLGIETEVKVGDEVATRERWFNGQLDGEWIIRPNEGRWDGAVGINALYVDFDSAVHLGGRREDNQAMALEALTVVDPEKRQEAMAAVYKVLHDEHYEWSTGITHFLYGVSPRIQGWQPWPLVAYITALWTIDIEE